MSGTSAVQTVPAQGVEVVATELPEQTVALYAPMIAAIPDAGAEGMANILDQIAKATTLTQLDAPWQAGGLQKYRDRQIVVVGARKMESDFAGGLGWFLILDCADPATGETFVATTGSVAIVAQVAKWWSMGDQPLRCIPRLAKNPTPNGFYPMHLEIVR